MNIESHWLQGARQCRSDNFDARPQDCSIDAIVIHNISLPPNQFGGGHVHELFSNQLDPAAHSYFAEIAGLRVSAHLLIERSGAVTQFVGFDQRAWHAGVSSWLGRSRVNDFSIGIELEGADHTPFEASQYRVLASVIEVLAVTYGGRLMSNIVGHNEISPGRKTDPGPAFDWSGLHVLLGTTPVADS